MLKTHTGIKLIAAAGLMALAACTHKPPATVEAPPVAPPPSSADTAPVTSESSTIIPGSAEDLRVNVGDTVHFDYDRYELRDEDRSVLQRQAEWLQKYAQVRVTIEGNCDERGTREYNLALGARRANAVKEYLVSLGVSGGRVDTISYGKERPVCTESSEDCNAQNRRGVTTVVSGAASS
ncbi:MAG: peptidoglycan-associated lipoprotein Pal [Alphaproteobacteria bacterium]|jgi:peptidoglycan-associated lipoprotein|nr:peptidoglycan-associated lipoprotein Pal [Alphaproteobacteria bacterium]